MRFKKPQVRYADTPQPPRRTKLPAGDERIGSPRVQAKNWRLMAFGCLTLALLMAGGGVALGAIHRDALRRGGGQRGPGTRAWATATPYRPNDAQTAHHIRDAGARAAIDPIVVRVAIATTRPTRALLLNDYARVNDPFARIGKESVTVQITSVARQRRALDGTPIRQRARRAWSGGRPWCPSCSSRAHRRTPAPNPWASTSTACHGAANWILPKEPSHE